MSTGAAPARLPAPTLHILLELAPGKPEPIEVRVLGEDITATVDVLFRVGGRELVEDLERELGQAAPPPGSPGIPQLASFLCANAMKAQRELVLGALLAVDQVARRVLRNQLDGARASLRLSRYGLVEVAQSGITPPVAADGRDTYRALRATVVALDMKRRAVRRWNFTIPENAPTAREQFDRTLAAYVDAYRQAAISWPVLAVSGASLLRDLGEKTTSDVQKWAQEPNQDGTPLDDLIKGALAKAWNDLIEEQPTFVDRLLAGAMKAAGLAEQRIDLFRPEKVFGEQHPLWRYPFLIHAALEELDWRPGDIGYAAAVSALRTAEKAAAAEKESAQAMESILGWASLGFGILLFVPVVGEIAVIAAVVTSSSLAFGNCVEFIDARERRQAVGPLADRFGFAEPDAAGFVVDLLGLAADIGLPVLGKAISGVLRPTGRLLAATRVQAVLDLSEHALDLAAVTVDANAALLEKEIERLQLDKVESRSQP